MTHVNRPDVYRNIHKALRKALFDFSYATGRVDIESNETLRALSRQFDELFYLLDMHGHKEDTYSLPLLESKRPGCTKHNEEEHEQIHLELSGLKSQMNALLDAEAETRKDCYWNFYYSINSFISGYLMHMQMEEIVMTNLFYELCNDDELKGMTAAILSSLAPNDSMLIARYMIPSLEPAERIQMMSQIQRTAPAPAFTALLKMSEEILSENEYKQLHDNLNQVVTVRV